MELDDTTEFVLLSSSNKICVTLSILFCHGKNTIDNFSWKTFNKKVGGCDIAVFYYIMK